VTHTTKAEMQRKFAAGIVDRPPGTDDVALGVGYLDYLDRVFQKDTGLTARLSTDGIADAQERRRFVAAAFNAGEGRVAGAQVQARKLGSTRRSSRTSGDSCRRSRGATSIACSAMRGGVGGGRPRRLSRELPRKSSRSRFTRSGFSCCTKLSGVGHVFDPRR
jgi:hypothetical protein